MPMNGVFGVSRLFRWNDITSDQTIGAAPKTRMITAAGVTNDQPATVSARRCARDRPEGRPWLTLRASAVTATSAGTCQGRVDLSRCLVQRRLRLRLAEQDRHDHGAEDLRDLRVGCDLRPGLLDV